MRTGRARLEAACERALAYCWLPRPSIGCDTTPTASSWKVRLVAIRKSPRRPRNQSLPTVRTLPILQPVGMSVRPEQTGSIMPIIAGSITPIGDTAHGFVGVRLELPDLVNSERRGMQQPDSRTVSVRFQYTWSCARYSSRES